MEKLSVLDAFAGIGGFSYGLEQTGYFRTEAFCEIDEYAQRVLAKNWPGVPIYDDIKKLTAARWRAAGHIRRPDVITGGFPCTDISATGKQAGIEGAESGLWDELGRIIGDFRPRYAIVENVAALLSGDRGRWFGRVLGDLAALGYCIEWHCIPASNLGAPHRRDRAWIIATDANQKPIREQQRRRAAGPPSLQPGNFGGPGDATHADVDRWAPERGGYDGEAEPIVEGGRDAQRFCEGLPDTLGKRLERIHESWTASRTIDGPRDGSHPGWWETEPDVGRVADGIPARVDRLRCLGNAIVPQHAQLIGFAIIEQEKILCRMK